jgi:hypothetical protein
VLLISLHEMSPVEGLSNPETQKVGKIFATSFPPEKIGGRVVLMFEKTRPKTFRNGPGFLGIFGESRAPLNPRPEPARHIAYFVTSRVGADLNVT